MRKKPIRWVLEDNSKLAKAAFEVWVTNDPGEKILWEIVAMDKVQEVLPPERRRKITGRHTVPAELKEIFQKLVAEFVAERNPPPEVYEVLKEVIIRPSTQDVLGQASPAEIFVEFAKRMAPKFADLLNPQSQSVPVSTQLAPVVRPSVPKEEIVQTLRPPKVVIYGFLDKQVPHIREKAEGFGLELVFISTEGKMKTGRPQANWHILNVTKMSHRHSDAVDKDSPSSRVITVHGVDGAMKALADINAKVGHGER